MPQKVWQKDKQGFIFWDTYLHPECEAVDYEETDEEKNETR